MRTGVAGSAATRFSRPDVIVAHIWQQIIYLIVENIDFGLIS